MEEQIVALLLADPGVALLVSTRVQWNARIQGEALPAIVLHRIGGTPDYHMQGPSGLVFSRVQADCWSATYKDALALKRAVTAALSGYTGGLIKGAFLDNERQDFEKPANGNAQYHRIILDFTIWHSEQE